MFAPTKTWRRWHRKINVTQKRFALVSAVAASGVTALVMARGHRIDQLPEVPLVVDNKVIDNVDKTSKAIALLTSLKAYDDVEKVKNSKKLRAGKGKMRNRRFTQKKGPLVIYNEKGPLVKAFRNLPGVELCSVTRLNLLQLAPGGNFGRFCIWTKDAFERLDSIYGTYRRASSEKTDYKLPRPMMTSTDLGRLINSNEIQSVLRFKKEPTKFQPKRNPLKNRQLLARLNPHGVAVKRRAILAGQRQTKKKAELLEAKRTGKKPQPTQKELDLKKKLKVTEKKNSAQRKKFIKSLLSK